MTFGETPSARFTNAVARSTNAGELVICQSAGAAAVFEPFPFGCVSWEGELYARRIGKREVFAPELMLRSDREPGLPIGEVAAIAIDTAVACASGDGFGMRVPGVDFRGVVRKAASSAEP